MKPKASENKAADVETKVDLQIEKQKLQAQLGSIQANLDVLSDLWNASIRQKQQIYERAKQLKIDLRA